MLFFIDQGKKWGERLSETISTLRNAHAALLKSIETVSMHRRADPIKDDVFLEIDLDGLVLCFCFLSCDNNFFSVQKLCWI